jgi:hypothetical protein
MSKNKTMRLLGYHPTFSYFDIIFKKIMRATNSKQCLYVSIMDDNIEDDENNNIAHNYVEGNDVEHNK